MVKNAIKVYARLKPEKSRKRVTNYEIFYRPKGHENEDFLVLTSPTKNPQEFIDNRPESWNFSFQKIFPEHATQDEVFENAARPVIHSVLEGYNGTIFAYGQTGSGKTHSIAGNYKNYDDRGILPRTVQYLFDIIRKHPENIYTVDVAYLEIYNENGYDLLERDVTMRLEDLPRVAIQEDQTGAMHLKNLVFRNVETENDALELFVQGDDNRVTSETPMNPESSRSHCIFTIVVSVKRVGEDCYTRAKLHLVDLAGSERVYKCAITGTILTEAKHINLSLHYLEQVIVCLGQESASHIPYRNSLLTSILRDSLGGNCMTTMLATLSVSSVNFEESISTCRFAQRVAMIKNDVDLIFEKDVQCENALLKLENERLKKQIALLTHSTSTCSHNSDLTREEKQHLKNQVDQFVVSERGSIDLDGNPKKLQYCFALLKGKAAARGSGEQSLRYYKDLVVQRDKEISLLIESWNKERKKNTMALIERSRRDMGVQTAVLSTLKSQRNFQEDSTPRKPMPECFQKVQENVPSNATFCQDNPKRDQSSPGLKGRSLNVLYQNPTEIETSGSQINVRRKWETRDPVYPGTRTSWNPAGGQPRPSDILDRIPVLNLSDGIKDDIVDFQRTFPTRRMNPLDTSVPPAKERTCQESQVQESANVSNKNRGASVTRLTIPGSGIQPEIGMGVTGNVDKEKEFLGGKDLPSRGGGKRTPGLSPGTPVSQKSDMDPQPPEAWRIEPGSRGNPKMRDIVPRNDIDCKKSNREIIRDRTGDKLEKNLEPLGMHERIDSRSESRKSVRTGCPNVHSKSFPSPVSKSPGRGSKSYTQTPAEAPDTPPVSGLATPSPAPVIAESLISGIKDPKSISGYWKFGNSEVNDSKSCENGLEASGGRNAASENEVDERNCRKRVSTWSSLETGMNVKPEVKETEGKRKIGESRVIVDKDLPLTGDPEIDEEIIAFYRAKRTGEDY